MSNPLEFAPGFVSPLTDKEHATIGRIAILWGQIESCVDDLLPHISGLTTEQVEALQLYNKPMSQKVAFLKGSVPRYPHDRFKEPILNFCALIDETKVQRNHVFHGMWGWRGDTKKQRVFPAARKQSSPDAPLPASKLPGLEKKLCKCSRLGFDVFAQIELGQLTRHPLTRFFHHRDEPDGSIPQWLEQWSERNPWNSDDPDQIAPAGQLPRRSSLYPEK